jgi:hypothetical protein
MPPGGCECVRVVATVATTAIRATAMNPVILLCFVMKTSYGPDPIQIQTLLYRMLISGRLRRLEKMASSELLVCDVGPTDEISSWKRDRFSIGEQLGHEN